MASLLPTRRAGLCSAWYLRSALTYSRTWPTSGDVAETRGGAVTLASALLTGPGCYSISVTMG